MDLKINFKPRKYTIKADNLKHAYHQILYKLPASDCSTYGIRPNGSKFTGKYNTCTKMLYVFKKFT